MPKDLLSEFAQKIGLWPFLALAVVVLTAVWGVAHWTAQPGKKVSVFWGLVEYSKTSVQQPTPPSKVKPPTLQIEKFQNGT